MDMKSILRKHRSHLALVIGNGVNRYEAPRDKGSWESLLLRLAERRLPGNFKVIPTGVALTEFYDVLDLRSRGASAELSVQKEFCGLLETWQYREHHTRIVAWAEREGVPILTTNFDRVLADAGNCSLHRIKGKWSTDFYPWESYFGTRPLDGPLDGFGIWHINGMSQYPRSLRLGLTHYMGSVNRVRGWLRSGGKSASTEPRYAATWPGADSWVHIAFNRPLLIFGLGLEENEVFLRWLLIERARYFEKTQQARKDAWYVHTGKAMSDGKEFFLKHMGVVPVHVLNYDQIYGMGTWG